MMAHGSGKGGTLGFVGSGEDEALVAPLGKASTEEEEGAVGCMRLRVGRLFLDPLALRRRER